MNKSPKVTVMVLTYNSDYTELMMTLSSLLIQKNVDMQIIVADDGSKIKWFEEIKKIFTKHSFEQYFFVDNIVNKGTVSNIVSALDKVEGDYIKLISPGDCLYGSNVLHDWLRYMIDNNIDMSFCNSVHYTGIVDNKFNIVRCLANPQFVNWDRRKPKNAWIYYTDVCLGAATLCRKDVMKHYLNIIYGRVKYSEDNIYRMMMYDNKNVSFFDKSCLLYKQGTGISTSKNDKWGGILYSDMVTTYEMIIGKLNNKGLQRLRLNIVVKLYKISINNKIMKKALRIRKGLYLYLINGMKLRYTSLEYKEDFLKEIMKIVENEVIE